MHNYTVGGVEKTVIYIIEIQECRKVAIGNKKKNSQNITPIG